jgi:mannitol-1-phosphate 5-dehydrogenase
VKPHLFTGFGFGPIQSGLFSAEAYKSGNFRRIVIAEIDRKLVDAVRKNNGSYYVNVASLTGIKAVEIQGIEIFNPSDDNDRAELLKALSQSTEICTSLPSVNYYDSGVNSVASLIAEGLHKSTAGAVIIYTAENNNHAAEILEEKISQKVGRIPNHIQFLNTVIGKMSQVVTDKAEIEEKGLKPIAPNIDRAFLVEEFNRILVTKCSVPGFKPGIEVFIEKENLLPFEEAKLYGHNAIHALLAYLGAGKGYTKMAELQHDTAIMQIARDAFINESGRALINKYAHLNDDLFTPGGYQAYADDLLKRMTNPWLGDTIERAARDSRRKLSENDRIFGTIKLAMEQGVDPVNFIKAARAGMEYVEGRKIQAHDIKMLLSKLLPLGDSGFKSEMVKLLQNA